MGQCGWCQSSQSCHMGSPSSIPSAPVCGLWAFGPSCPADCSIKTSCGSCVPHAHCTWCESSQTCSYVYEPDTCPASDSHLGFCPLDCSQLDSCSSCSQLDSCGWCASTGTCMRGKPDDATGVLPENSCPSDPPISATPNPPGSSPTNPNWFFSSCDALCETRIQGEDTTSACSVCTADPSCGYCPFTPSSPGVGSCVPGSSNSPLGGGCSSYTFGSCPAISPILPGTVRAGVLAPASSRLFSVTTTSGSQTLSLTLSASTSNAQVMMYASSRHFVPGPSGTEWSTTSPDTLVIAPANYPNTGSIPVGPFFVSLFCSSGSTSCPFRLTVSLGSPAPPPTNSAFWIVYFVGVIFGILFGILLIAIIIRKLREASPANARAARQGMFVNRRVRPFVPLRVLVPGKEDVASPWFLLLPTGQDEPSVHAIITFPDGSHKVGQVVKTAPGKKMVRVSNRRAISSAPSTFTELIPDPEVPPAAPNNSLEFHVNNALGDEDGDSILDDDPFALPSPSPLPSHNSDLDFSAIIPLPAPIPSENPTLLRGTISSAGPGVGSSITDDDQLSDSSLDFTASRDHSSSSA